MPFAAPKLILVPEVTTPSRRLIVIDSGISPISKRAFAVLGVADEFGRLIPGVPTTTLQVQTSEIYDQIFDDELNTMFVGRMIAAGIATGALPENTTVTDSETEA